MTNEMSDSDYVTSHEIGLTDLTPATIYYFKAWSTSKEGWAGQSIDVYYFKTQKQGGGEGIPVTKYAV
jgi:hypothetical protein